MIPEMFIESWRTHVPWQTLAMVEQDLVISRALIHLYNHPKIQDSLIILRHRIFCILVPGLVMLFDDLKKHCFSGLRGLYIDCAFF